MEKILLTPVEVADALGISRSKTYDMIATGDLPSVRVGGRVRVPAVSLTRWIEERVSGVSTPSDGAVVPRGARD